MAEDALDPGADGTFPFAPWQPDGSLHPERWPTGARAHRPRGRGKQPPRPVIVDPEPRRPDGEPVVPHSRPLPGGGA